MEPRTASGTTELRYCTASGDEVTTTLDGVDVATVAEGAPVREFSWRPKQGNYPGWLWTATTGTLVGYESLLERDRVLLGRLRPGRDRNRQPTVLARPVSAAQSEPGPERVLPDPDQLGVQLVRHRGAHGGIRCSTRTLCCSPIRWATRERWHALGSRSTQNRAAAPLDGRDATIGARSA